MGVATSLAWMLLGATIPLSGTVVDDHGRPVAGASVWLGDTNATRSGPETIATAATDEQGRFQLQRPDDLAGRGTSWSPTLWAYHPGRRLGFIEFKRHIPGVDEPVRLELGPPASTPIRVLESDGQPAAKVGVRPVNLSLKAPRPPDKLVERLATATNADGRATIDGLAPADFSWVDVKVEGQVVQWLPIDAETGDVILRPLGRLRARIVSDDAAELAGWTITATSRPVEAGYRGPYSTHWAREKTGGDGRVEFPPLARGQISWKIEPPAGSAYLVVKPPAASIQTGRTTEVEIPIRRGVRLEGIVHEEAGGSPIQGVPLNFIPLQAGSTTVQLHDVVTDDQGRVSAVTPPGTIRVSYSPFRMPADYFLPPNIPNWVDVQVEEGEERHEFTLPKLRKAAKVRGRVIDEEGEPVVAAVVRGNWTSPEFERSSTGLHVATDSQGEFMLGGIAPGASVRVTANDGVRAESEPVTIARAGEGEPISLRIRAKPTRLVSGRVVDAEGRPIPGASIKVWIRPADDHMNLGGEFSFEGPKEVRTEADGRYSTPKQIPKEMQARVVATADGYEPTKSLWLPPKSVEVPPLTLRRSIGVRTVSGRVVDAEGRPIAGVEVFQTGDGPRRAGPPTDADGRFRIDRVPDAPALIFARKEGFHFLDRRINPGEPTVELTLLRIDAPPTAPLRLAEPAVPREVEQAMALELAEAARRELSAGEPVQQQQQRRSIDVAVALADPDRMIERIENQVVAADAEILAALATRLWEREPRKALDVLRATDHTTATTAALALFDALGRAAAPEFRRTLLKHADDQARAIEDSAQASIQLARTADRWFDLGDADRGSELVREAQIRADQPRPQLFLEPRDELAPILARVDLPAALRLLEGLDQNPNQRYRIDQALTAIVKRIAATDPAGARRLFDRIQRRPKAPLQRSACLRMAAGDLAEARKLAAEDGDPLVEALVPAAAAQARAESDPEAARTLLREAVERIGRLAVDRSEKTPPAPSVVLARLLPLTIQIDPDRAPDVLALALSLRAAPPIQAGASMMLLPDARRYYVDQAELAARVSRYNRAAAEVVFRSVADRLVDLDHEFMGLGSDGQAAFRAAGAYDARVALALLEALPPDPTPPPPGIMEAGRPRHRGKADARIILAQTLASPPAIRLRAPSTPGGGEEWLNEIDD